MELAHGRIVRHDDVAALQLGGEGHLGRDALRGGRRVDGVARDYTMKLRLGGRRDDHRQRADLVELELEEQRRVQNNERRAHAHVVADGLHQRLRDEGPHQPIQPPPLRDITKNRRAQRRAVQRSTGVDGAREFARQRPRAARVGLLEVVHQRVAVDHGDVLFAEPGRHRGLAAGNSSCEAHEEHVSC